ncbi:sigma-70 family RNA polymerase sigma factor [Acidovorax sp. NCPPB 2350]|nr:sigma-70 family RNA polymerase sigma factor [Acidovorax sp. NCPPB 2350]
MGDIANAPPTLLPAAPPTDVTNLYRHHAWLQGWLRRKVDCSHSAADLAQDTFVRILGRGRLPAIQEPRPYLATVARGLLIDFYRRRSLEQAYLETLAGLPEPMAPSPEERATVLEALTAIDAMLDGLKPAVREAFLLSQLEGLGHAAIAERLHVTVRTVTNYLRTALEHCWDLAP